MTIKFNPSIHLSSRGAYSRHYENLRKDKEWENAVQEYSRILDREKLFESFVHTSEAIQNHRKYIQERKEALEIRWPQLKKIF